MSKNLFLLFTVAGSCGEVFFVLGGRNLEQSAAIAHGLRVGCGEERAGGALPADCAPAGCVTCQKCYVVGNDPCVVPVRLKDTFLWLQIYPPSSVAYGASFPPRGSLPLVLQAIWRVIQTLIHQKNILQKARPDERVAHHSLPLRGGRKLRAVCRRRQRMRASHESNPRFKVLFTLFAQCKEGFPFEEEENCEQFVAVGDE